jgi:hypothetical protein
MTTNTWIIDQPNVRPQAIDVSDTVQNHPLGTIVKAKHSTYGEGEFIYLAGVASTVVGLVVTYKNSTGVTELIPNTANMSRPVAVAMSACVAGEYGWYQIGGSAVVKKTAVKVDPAVARQVYISATVGRVMQTSAAGKNILGMRWEATTTVTSTTSTAVVTLNRPHAQGPIT